MSNKPRKGSMAEADAKTLKTVLIVFTAIFGIADLLFILPINTFFHQYFVNAGIGWKIIGILSCIGHFAFLWTKWKDLDSAAGVKVTPQAATLFFWAALNLCMLGGFDFTL
jgi:hypothetical protein